MAADDAESAHDAWRESVAELGITTVSLARVELQMDWSLTTPTARGGSPAQQVRQDRSPAATLSACSWKDHELELQTLL